MSNTPSIPKSHHFVPQMHARRFTDASGRFWLHNKKAGKSYSSSPKQAFCETHLYTKEDAAGAKDTSLETWFSGLEGNANTLIEKIVAAIRAGETPSISDQERETWDRYFYMLWKRTPDALAKVPTLQQADAHLTKLFADFAALGPELAAEVAKLDTPEQRSRLVQGSKVGAIERVPGDVLEAFSDKGVMILRITDPDLHFVIGSLPVARMAGNLKDQETEVWLPIASDIAMGYAGATGPIKVIELASADEVAKLNGVIAGQSSSFASASKSTIDGLVSALLDQKTE